MYGVTGYFGNPYLPLKVGNGKTLWLVHDLYEAYKQGKKVYTNLDVNFKHVKINSFFDILKNNLGDCVVGVDEIKTFLGTKYTGLPSDLKDDVLAFVSQQRKRKIPFIYTNQEFNSAPLFIRELTSFFFISHKIHKPAKIPSSFLRDLTFFSCLNDDGECEEEHAFIAEPISIFGGTFLKYRILDKQDNIKKLYSLYDTYQIIDKISYKKADRIKRGDKYKQKRKK